MRTFKVTLFIYIAVVNVVSHERHQHLQIQSLAYYQWDCSRKCCLITSHTGCQSLQSLWSNLSMFVYLIPTVQDHWGVNMRIVSQGGFLHSAWPRFDCSCLALQGEDLISCFHGATNLIFVLFLCKSTKKHLHLNVLCNQYLLWHL